MSARRFIKGMVCGALFGGAIALLDKETRRDVLAKSKDVGENVAGLIKNPKNKLADLQSKVTEFRDSFREINEDIQFLAEKVSEIKDLGVETVKTIEETKNVFHKENMDKSEMDPTQH